MCVCDVCSIIVKALQNEKTPMAVFLNLNLNLESRVVSPFDVPTKYLIDLHLPGDNWISCEIRSNFMFYRLMTIEIDFQV